MTALPILLVEDDADVRDAMIEVLEAGGYSVVAAGDGQEALDLLRGGTRPFIILLDLMMAGMNGFQFRQEQLASADLASIPVVVLSADGRIHEKASSLGAAYHVKKPVDIPKLFEILARHRDG